MRFSIYVVLLFLAVSVRAVDYAVPTEIGAKLVNGSSSQMTQTPNYGYPVSPAVKVLPEKYRIIDNGTVRPKTQEERDAIDAITVTNVAVKTSGALGSEPVIEAEQIYVTLYQTILGDTSYTNTEYAYVATVVAGIALTNDWVAARTDLMQSSFWTIHGWWQGARQELGIVQSGFHPYPWGQTAVTNIVPKYP